MKRILAGVSIVLLINTGLLHGLFSPNVSFISEARSIDTLGSSGTGVQNLVYGSSTPWDVQQALGRIPDETIRAQQMYPVIQNDFYYDEEATGAATLFVYENGLLVGMHYRSSNNQLVDLTYFLINNGDRSLNSPLLHGYQSYFPNMNIYYFGDLEDE